MSGTRSGPPYPPGVVEGRWKAPPVLVTGSNRSGTTWVGRMLAASGELEYVHEPFNPGLWPRPLGIRLGGHYTYVSTDNEAEFIGPVKRVLEYRPPVARQIVEARRPRDLGRVGKAVLTVDRARLRRRRPLLKDPIAIFATPWLARRFDVQVVMMIRHPAAYVSSINRLAWNYDFGYMLSQPALMRDLLGPWRAEIEARARVPAPPFEQAITLWRIMYGVVARWQDEHPEWDFVRYEDLAGAPLDGFERLYGRLGLTWDESTRALIDSFTGEGNPSERSVAERHNVKRDSKAATRSWLGRLSPEEIARVREGVGEIADRFYGPEDWLTD